MTWDAPYENPVTMPNCLGPSAELNSSSGRTMNSKRNEPFRSTAIERNPLSRSDSGPEQRKLVRGELNLREHLRPLREIALDRVQAPVSLGVGILARDVLLVLGYPFLSPRGFELEVTFLGKAATWVLYAAIALVLVTEEGTRWPRVILWTGIALSLGAGVQYALRAWRHVRAGRDSALETEP